MQPKDHTLHLWERQAFLCVYVYKQRQKSLEIMLWIALIENELWGGSCHTLKQYLYIVIVQTNIRQCHFNPMLW